MILSLLNSKVNVYSQVMILNDWDTKWLHCALAAAQCIVIGPICLWGRGVVCYHDNSKLHASILTKLGLLVKVVTISSWLNFWPPRAPGKVVCGGAKIFGSALLQPARSVCVSSERFFFIFSYNGRNQSQPLNDLKSKFKKITAFESDFKSRSKDPQTGLKSWFQIKYFKSFHQTLPSNPLPHHFTITERSATKLCVWVIKINVA